MNIVLLGNAYLAEALAAEGHRVFLAGSMGDNLDLRLSSPLAAGRLTALLMEQGFAPDILIQADDGNLPAVLGLEELPIPLIFQSIDTFCNPWHIPFAHAFDRTLVAQKDFVPMFTGEGHAARWFPLCANSPQPLQTEEEWLAQRNLPVVFVGTLRPKNIPERLPFLQAFQALRPLTIQQGDYRPLFARARVALNQSAFGEVNYRCFEAMGCGAALLHDSSLQGFEDLFEPGRTVLPSYPRLNAQAAAAAAAFWLARPAQLARLALAGTALVLKNHSAAARARELSALGEELLREQAHRVRLAELARRRLLLSSAYGALAAELPDSMSVHREFYARAALELQHERHGCSV